MRHRVRRDIHEKERTTSPCRTIHPCPHRTPWRAIFVYPRNPNRIQKARGPLLDEVLGQGMLEETSILIDDVAESTPTPLPIQTRVMLDYEEINIETVGMRLNAFDREVIDAVVSLRPYNDYITPEMIYQVMMGKQTARYITDKQREMVRKSLMRCSHARIRISLTDMSEKNSPIGRQLKNRELKRNILSRYCLSS